jgi:hypothetical protein
MNCCASLQVLLLVLLLPFLQQHGLTTVTLSAR